MITSEKLTIDTCLASVKEICKENNFTEDELKHRARILYLLNKLNFWQDFPVLVEEIIYQKELAKNNNESEIKNTNETLTICQKQGYHSPCDLVKLEDGNIRCKSCKKIFDKDETNFLEPIPSTETKIEDCHFCNGTGKRNNSHGHDVKEFYPDLE